MAATATTAPRPKARSKLRDSLYAYSFISPAIIAMIVASFIPIAFTIMMAFSNWDLYHPALIANFPYFKFHWVGLQNFRTIWSDLTSSGELVGVIIWTLVFATISTLLNFFVGLFMAFLLNNPNMRERNLYRTVLILPWAVPGAIMTLAWAQLLYSPPYGPIDILLGSFHLGQVDWLNDPNWARFWVIVVNLWFGYPFMMTACLGALQSIPVELGEAAQVDGAGILTRFWRITFPLLRSATLPLIISTFAYNLNNFGAIYLLTAGGPTTIGHEAGSTDILPTYTYKLAIDKSLFSLSAAYSIVIFLFIGSLSLMQMKYSRAFEEVDR